jgi:hypothetical protein
MAKLRRPSLCGPSTACVLVARVPKPYFTHARLGSVGRLSPVQGSRSVSVVQEMFPPVNVRRSGWIRPVRGEQ